MSAKEPSFEIESNVKLALALIVKGSDEEAMRLSKCLEDMPQYLDGIFITITQPNEKVEAIAKKYGAHISHYEWNYNFADARNFNFAQVPKDYTHILWLDADDGFRGLPRLKSVLADYPDVDTFIVNYMYGFDEDKNPTVIHMKTQIVKNDGCVRWVGAIHEDFEATREITPYFLKGFERIHMSDGDRIEDSKVRNLEIAAKQVEKNPEDPRSWWNLGNAERAMDKYQAAFESFEKFLLLSRSDEEKYLCRIRRAECMWAMGEKFKAIDEARYAIGIKPEYPDAYGLLGGLYLETSQYENAINIYLQALTKKPPIYSILVYNPRDYDYQPMKNLAKAYWLVSRPDMARPLLEACVKIMPSDTHSKAILDELVKQEKIFNDVLKTGEKLKKLKSAKGLEKALAKLPIEVQSHPAIAALRNARIVKEKSSGKDLVFYCGNTSETWNPETARTKGIGGSEEAVIWLSKLLSKKGWNVEVYANCGTETKVYEGVTWKPYWTWNLRDKQDVVILWRHPAPLKYDINAPKIYVDMHDAIKDGEFTPERIKKLTKVFVKSEFHRSLFPSVPDEKIVVVPNGIDASLFEAHEERDQMLMVNTSSADRSLSAALDCYEEIKKSVPKAQLVWAYGWGIFDVAHGDNPKIMEWKQNMERRMKELGVENVGRLSHGEIAKLYMKANVFLYPSEFAEIDCISLSKAMASGAVPLTTDFAAMGGKKKHGGLFVHSDKTKDDWAKPYQFDFALESGEKKKIISEAAITLLSSKPAEDTREAMRAWARYEFDWNKVADTWDKTLCE